MQIQQALKLMRENAVSTGTKANYARELQHWFRFCAITFHDPLDPSCHAIEIFIGYLFCYTDVNGDQAGRTLTALRNHFLESKIDWFRPQWITYLLKGFRSLKPKKIRPKRPFCHILIYYFNKYVFTEGDFLHTSIWLGMLFGYFGGMRPGEYTKTSHSTPLLLKQITWNPSADAPREVIITLHRSKTNRHGAKKEQITLDCNCGKHRFGYPSPCPVHLLVKFLMMRKQKFGSMKLSQPLLVDYKNKRLKYDLLRKFIKNGITTVSKRTGVTLSPRYYTPHSLRVGGCTDLSRLGAASYKVSIFGRWTSDCWKQIYVNIDFIDLARLRGTTVAVLRNQLFIS